jgi:alpha/beta superfamily hydrolase
MSGGISGGPMDNLAHLAQVKAPMLDLYGSDDLPEVIASAANRAAQAAKGSADYTQLQVAGADHFFDGEEQALLEAVNAWLTQRY